MGTIINFPADPVARRLVVNVSPAPRNVSAQILILPAIRIERQSDDNGSGPEQGTTGRRGKRRARS
jgi:hypothetical protein